MRILKEATYVLGYFPRPLPDELFFSIVLRFAIHAGMPNTSSIVSELTGNHTLAVDTRLANDLGHLVANLPPGHGATIDEFLDQHTLLPLYGSALTAAQTRLLRMRAVGPTGRSRSTSQRLARGLQERAVYPTTSADLANKMALELLPSLPIARHLRYCPQCVVADREAYGEPYWHRIHQVRGIYICAQHGVLLHPGLSDSRRTIPYTQFAHGRGRRLLVDSDLPTEDYRRIELESPAGRQQMRLISEIAWLLAQPSAQTPLLSLRQRAMSVARRSGLVQRGYLLQTNPVSGQVWHMYMHAISQEVSRSHVFNIVIGTDEFWRKAVAGRIFVGDPVPWLLMIWTAGYTLESILQPR